MSGTDSLLKLVAAFEAAGVPYMIVGSYSSNFYGIPRMTKDADLVVHLDARGWQTLPTLLPEGIELEEQMGFGMVTATQRELLRVKESLFQIELFRLSEDVHDRMRFDRRVRQTIFPDVDVSLPTAEDVMIIQKLRWSRDAKRPKDYAERWRSCRCKANPSTGPTSYTGVPNTTPLTCSPKPRPRPPWFGRRTNGRMPLDRSRHGYRTENIRARLHYV